MKKYLNWNVNQKCHNGNMVCCTPKHQNHYVIFVTNLQHEKHYQ